MKKIMSHQAVMKFSKVVNGFLIGVGFATGFMAIFALYALTVEQRVREVVQNNISKVMTELDNNYVDAMKLEIVDYEAKEHVIDIAVKSVNYRDPVFSSFFTIRLSLFSKNSKFIGNCDHKIPAVNSKEDVIYYSLSCETTFAPVSEFKFANISVISTRDRTLLY